MSILVTGTAGFIGFHVAKTLLSKGHEVVGIDNHNSYYDPQLKEDRAKQLLEQNNYTHLRVDISVFYGIHTFGITFCFCMAYKYSQK